jgi:Nif-specific regulatory protein
MKTKPDKEFELLSEIATAFAESLNLEQTLKSMLKSLDTHLKLRRGMITLLDPDAETINIRVAHGLSAKSMSQVTYRIGEGVTGTVVQSGEQIVVPDISKDPRFLHRKRQKDRLLLCPR